MDADWWARGIGICGTALAAWSLWLNYKKGMVRLKVIPIVRRNGGAAIPPYIEAIRVVNNSHFPVEIAEVGVVTTEGNRKRIYERFPPAVAAELAKAVTIDARSSFNFKPDSHMVILSALNSIRTCYVEAANGTVFEAKARKTKRRIKLVTEREL